MNPVDSCIFEQVSYSFASICHRTRIGHFKLLQFFMILIRSLCKSTYKINIFSRLVDNDPSGCRWVVVASRPKKLIKKDCRLCLNRGTIVRLLDAMIDCNNNKSVKSSSIPSSIFTSTELLYDLITVLMKRYVLDAVPHLPIIARTLSCLTTSQSVV